ncbi:NAD(P)-dependent oxidoreductase, partial [Pseudomonas aeruginosa]
MSASLPSLAFAGLGLMGVPMCRRLLALDLAREVRQ